MNDNIFDPAVCPSSLDEDGEAMTAGETAHRWDASTDPATCAECGAEKTADLKADHKSLTTVYLLHVALDPSMSMDRLDAIRDDMAERYPELVASGFHGSRRFDPDYPTQV